jgi:hypothetical protein
VTEWAYRQVFTANTDRTHALVPRLRLFQRLHLGHRQRNGHEPPQGISHGRPGDVPADGQTTTSSVVGPYSESLVIVNRSQ